MQIEIQGIPQSLKSAYSARLKAAQSDLSRYKKLSKEAHTQVSRSDLLGRGNSGGWGLGRGGSRSDEPYGDGEGGERDRLLIGTQTLDDGSRCVIIILYFSVFPFYPLPLLNTDSLHDFANA